MCKHVLVVPEGQRVHAQVYLCPGNILTPDEYNHLHDWLEEQVRALEDKHLDAPDIASHPER